MKKQYYIIKLTSYYGENSSLQCCTEKNDYMYCVLIVNENDAEIVDMGYPDLKTLLDAWKNTRFQNTEQFL